MDPMLGPGEWFQPDRPLAAPGESAGDASIQRTAGNSRFAACGVPNDSVTSDGSCNPMSQ